MDSQLIFFSRIEGVRLSRNQKKTLRTMAFMVQKISRTKKLKVFTSLYLSILDEKPCSLLQLAWDTRNHQIRQCSTKDYYNLIGSTKYSSRLQRLKTIKGLTSVEANISTQNTCTVVQFRMAYLFSIISLSIKINYFLSMTKILKKVVFFIHIYREKIRKDQKYSFSYIHFIANVDAFAG